MVDCCCVVYRYRAIMWPLKSHSSKSRTKVTILIINTVQYSTVQYITLQVTILIIWIVATLLAVPLAVAFRAEVSTVLYSTVQIGWLFVLLLKTIFN